MQRSLPRDAARRACDATPRFRSWSRSPWREQLQGDQSQGNQSLGRRRRPGIRRPTSRAFYIGEIRKHMSKSFERWKELAALCLREKDPAKLTELASEMNLALAQKTPPAEPYTLPIPGSS